MLVEQTGGAAVSGGLNEEQAREAFAVVDTNGDGMISERELRHLSERLGEPFSDEQIDKIFNAADSDRDRLISLEEFVSLLSHREV
jgi:Ca2+-binding EF-hand superfamily protein